MEFMHWLDGPIDYARVYLADNIRNLGLHNAADDPKAFLGRRKRCTICFRMIALPCWITT